MCLCGHEHSVIEGPLVVIMWFNCLAVSLNYKTSSVLLVSRRLICFSVMFCFHPNFIVFYFLIFHCVMIFPSDLILNNAEINILLECRQGHWFDFALDLLNSNTVCWKWAHCQSNLNPRGQVYPAGVELPRRSPLHWGHQAWNWLKAIRGCSL